MEVNRSTKTMKIQRLLIANRGEIVSRILSTCEKLSIDAIVVYSTEDDNLSYIQKAKESIELPGSSLEETYLNQDLLIELAKKTRADAIHPGYGFLSENADFAQKCINNKLIWIGPSPSIMRRMADKTEARKLAQNINIPTIPAFSGTKERLVETLTKEDLHKIIDIELKDLLKRVTGLGYKARISNSAVREGYPIWIRIIKRSN